MDRSGGNAGVTAVMDIGGWEHKAWMAWGHGSWMQAGMITFANVEGCWGVGEDLVKSKE